MSNCRNDEEVIVLGTQDVQNNLIQSNISIPTFKVSTDNVLNQLMKQNEILINLLTLQNNNANAEPKVIPVVPD